MRKLIVAVIVIGLAYFGYTHFFGAAPGPGMPGYGGPMPVGVATVVQRDAVVWDEFGGRLVAVDRVEIRPRVAGTIDAIHFQEGQMVAKDQLLFTIDPKPFEAAMQAAQAISTYTEGERNRAARLLPAKTVSQSEFDIKKNAAEVALANLTKAQLDLGYTQIKAPIAGRVSRAEITVGNLVNAGGDSPLLTTVVSLDPIYVDVDVDEQSFVRYMKAHGGNADALRDVPVRLALSGQNEFAYEGHITSFDNEVNTRAGSVRMRAVFDNKNGALIPGLYGRLQVGGSGRQNVLLINENAISTDQSKKFVYVVGEGNRPEYRVIKPGAMVDGLRVVESGVLPGEKIIISGLQRVQMMPPGTPILPEMMEMDGKETAAGGGQMSAEEKKE